MNTKNKPKLSPKKRYLQIALNSTLYEAKKIISHLPLSERVILEAGTPLIKRYGVDGIAKIKNWYSRHLSGQPIHLRPSAVPTLYPPIFEKISEFIEKANRPKKEIAKSLKQAEVERRINPYVVADLKMMDRGTTEVEIAANAGVDAAVALGTAPTESIDAFIEACDELEIDAMIDMMNVGFPLHVLRKLKKPPRVVILHRGVDEEHFNKEKQLPLHEIRRIKSNYNDVLISVAGGDTMREVQRAIFNDADIVVVWKSFMQDSKQTGNLANQFLKEIR